MDNLFIFFKSVHMSTVEGLYHVKHLNKANIFSLNRIHGYIRVKIDDAVSCNLSKKTLLTFPDILMHLISYIKSDFIFYFKIIVLWIEVCPYKSKQISDQRSLVQTGVI